MIHPKAYHPSMAAALQCGCLVHREVDKKAHMSKSNITKKNIRQQSHLLSAKGIFAGDNSLPGIIITHMIAHMKITHYNLLAWTIPHIGQLWWTIAYK